MLDTRGVFARLYGDPQPLFGKPAAQLAERSYEEALNPEQAQSWGSRFARALGGEKVMLRERRGEMAWAVILFPIRLEGAVQYACGTAREVTHWAEAEQELRRTVLGALRAQEYQRTSASKFLHDCVGQNLTALGLQLDLVRMDLEEEHSKVCSQIVDVQKLLETIVEQVRVYSYELNPSTVERAGLRAALDLFHTRIRQRYAGALRIKVNPSLKIEPRIAIAMYHIAHEAVENAVQHSSCSAIEIAVKSTRTGPRLEVHDNGKGFEPGDLRNGARGLGLLTMEHYAAQAGMDLSIKSGNTAGTTIALAPPPASERGGS